MRFGPNTAQVEAFLEACRALGQNDGQSLAGARLELERQLGTMAVADKDLRCREEARAAAGKASPDRTEALEEALRAADDVCAGLDRKAGMVVKNAIYALVASDLIPPPVFEWLYQPMWDFLRWRQSGVSAEPGVETPYE